MQSTDWFELLVRNAPAGQYPKEAIEEVGGPAGTNGLCAIAHSKPECQFLERPQPVDRTALGTCAGVACRKSAATNFRVIRPARRSGRGDGPVQGRGAGRPARQNRCVQSLLHGQPQPGHCGLGTGSGLQKQATRRRLLLCGLNVPFSSGWRFQLRGVVFTIPA